MFYNTLLLSVIAEKRQMKKFYKKVDEPLKEGCNHDSIVTSLIAKKLKGNIHRNAKQ